LDIACTSRLPFYEHWGENLGSKNPKAPKASSTGWKNRCTLLQTSFTSDPMWQRLGSLPFEGCRVLISETNSISSILMKKMPSYKKHIILRFQECIIQNHRITQ